MNPEEKELLEKTYELSKENNHILKGIKNSKRWSALFRFIYWIIIVGVSVGVFYFVQPYINSVLKMYNDIQNNLDTIKSVIDKVPK